MGSLSIWHWLIVLVVVVLIFGTKKLRNIGTDLGSAVKGFKEGMKSEDEKSARRKRKFRLPPARPSKAKRRKKRLNVRRKTQGVKREELNTPHSFPLSFHHAFPCLTSDFPR